MNKKYVYLKVFLYLSLLFIIVPIMTLPLWAFFGRWEWPNLIPTGFSLRAIKHILSNNITLLKVIINSAILSFIVAILASIIGLMTSRALVFYNFRFKKAVSFFSMLPIIVPSTAFAMGIHVIFIKLGWANTYFGVILVQLIYSVPYTVNILLDITSLIGDKLEIQSQVLGVSPFQSFAYITLPLLFPGIVSAVSMAYIISFSQYFLTLLIGGGTIETLSTIMVPFIQSGDRSMASVYAMIFMISIFVVFLLLEMKYVRRKLFETVSK